MWIHRSEFQTLNAEHVACKSVVAAARPVRSRQKHATFNASLLAEGGGRVSGRWGSCKVWDVCGNIHACTASITAPCSVLPCCLITRRVNSYLSCGSSCFGRSAANVHFLLGNVTSVLLMLCSSLRPGNSCEAFGISTQTFRPANFTKCDTV